VLATDGTRTFAIFLYEDIQWTTGDNDGGIDGLGGIPAQVGFNRGNGIDFAAIPASRTPNVINLASTSNVRVPGVYIFQISGNMIPIQYGKHNIFHQEIILRKGHPNIYSWFYKK